MKTITKYSQDLISNKGFLTGSTLFGCRSKDSDYDFLVMDKVIDFQELLDNNFEYKASDYSLDYFYSAYGKSSTGDLINVLVFASQLEFDAHVYASNTLLILLSNGLLTVDDINEKKKRIQVFEYLKKIYKIIN